NGQQYFNYINNFIGAKYEYYGDVRDIAGVNEPSDITSIADLESKSSVKAAYGTNFAADSWTAPNKKPRLELGFNFDSIRLGGSGTDTTYKGIYQYGSSRNKTGFYKITLYALGHSNIEKLVYVPNQEPLTLSKESMNLVKGQSQTLASSYVDPTGKITRIDWGSSDENVATVDENGKVTGIAAGTATVTAEAINVATGRDGTVTESTVYTAECKVTVSNPALDSPTNQLPTSVNQPPAAPQTASITLNVSAATLYHKGSKSKTTLVATVAGAAADVAWTSSNTKVATVNGSGVVTAKSKGTATITATANGVTATATITVKNATLTLKKQSATIKKGKTAAIKATATPNAKVSYKSSNKKVATVTAGGVVKGKKKGSATITVTANGVTKKFKVTVK
ncbi:MAG: Ig-like domain-containing protein, partial [Clostridiales Family XIII bacterium]|nr:Ig-like domain-containing protein [Clostridiales Family XIII bacterium]